MPGPRHEGSESLYRAGDFSHVTWLGCLNQSRSDLAVLSFEMYLA